jgi:hypothetical protein
LNGDVLTPLAEGVRLKVLILGTSGLAKAQRRGGAVPTAAIVEFAASAEVV